MEKKIQAWLFATGMVEPIVDKHELVAYQTGGTIFGGGSKMTPTDQHVDQVLRIADWLLED